jgi:hypothetical protein
MAEHPAILPRHGELVGTTTDLAEPDALVAQWTEQDPSKVSVAGSNPVEGATQTTVHNRMARTNNKVLGRDTSTRRRRWPRLKPVVQPPSTNL